MTLKLIPALSLSLLAALATACDRGHADLEDPFECEEVVTVLAGPEAASAIGFTAAEVLATVSGSHSAPLHWHQGAIQVGPESGASELTVEVTYAGGEIRFVDAKSPYGDEAGGQCAPRLEIDAEIKLHTAGGALDEAFTATLRAVRPDVAVLAHEIEVDAIEGTLEVTSIEPAEGKAAPMNLGVGIAAFGLFGAFDGGVEVVSGDTAAYGFHNYATFPSAEPECEFPAEATLPFDVAWGSHSAADALALLDAFPSLSLQWEGDAATSLTISATPSGGSACGRIAPLGADAGLRFGVDVTMKSDDGRLDGVVALEGRSELDLEGALTALRIDRVAPYGDVAAPEDFEARFGVHGVDLGGYDGGGITFSLTCDAEGLAGNLTVLGATIHECSDDPGAGCEGTDMTEIVSGLWTSEGA
ncbi:MAG: hypothetical protein R3B09_26130 [Nannocystaceae bacterium]